MVMKTNNQKFALAIHVLFALLLSSFRLNAEGITVLKSDHNTLKLRINTQFQAFSPLTVDGISYILPTFSNSFPFVNAENSGGPSEFRTTGTFTVPHPSGFKLSNFEVIKSRKTNGTLAPNPKLSTTELEYSLDSYKYENYKNSPAIDLQYQGIAVNNHIAMFALSPIRYNNLSNEIEIIEIAEITIEFNQSKPNISNKSVGQVSNFTTNSNVADSWRVSSNRILTDADKSDKPLASTEMQWAKITISREGAYYLDANDFSKLGVNLTPELINTIKIYGYGGDILDENPGNTQYSSLNEQAIIVQKSSNGNLDKVVFYASATSGIKKIRTKNSSQYERYINPYTFKSTYLLAWGGSDGLRAIPDEYPATDIINKPTTYRHFIYAEDEIENAFKEGSGRQWIGKTSFPMTISNQLYNLDRSGQIEYKAVLAHRLSKSKENPQPYGVFNLYENNHKFATLSLAASEEDLNRHYKVQSELASSIAADDRSIFKIDYSVTVKNHYGIPYLDYYIISYPRSFAAINNELSLLLDKELRGATELTITDFKNGSLIYAWDISNATQPKLCRNYSNTGSIAILRFEATDSSAYQFYLSSSLAKAVPEKITFPNLRADHSTPDILVITHPNLKASADKYAEYRNSQGKYTAKVFLTTDIYTEFASTMPDPSAIRNFIKYKFLNSDKAPKYVLLWGDAHYDYRNLITKTPNYVPTWESKDDDMTEFSSTFSFCTDDYYAWVNGNDFIADISVGRMPIGNDDAALIMLDKIKRYENESTADDWKTRITFLADDASKSNGEIETGVHVSQSEDAANSIYTKNFQVNKIYLPEYPFENQQSGRRKPKVTEDLLSTINTSGTLVLNYIGHGNPRVLTHEEVFEREKTIPLFRNTNKMFYAFAATCDFGRFDLADVNSGAEELVKYQQGAAIAMLTPSRSVYIADNGSYTMKFFQHLMMRNADNSVRTIGEATLGLKMNSLSTGSDIDRNNAKYILFGDPAVKLHFPESYVQIQTINDVNLQANTDTIELKGLSKVTITGRILNQDSTTNTNFNGHAIISLFEASENIKVVEPEANSWINYIRKPGNALSKSSTSVINGEFVSEFIIPKDISFAQGSGKILVYAIQNQGNETANGTTDRIKINGIEETANIEDIGPEIKIFMDSRNFASGDMVSNTPLLILDLSDDTGINTAGAGIGHRIEAWIDDNNESIDLTSLYRSSFTNPKAGSIEKVLYDLPQGVHTIKIRAWDVFNNPTTSYSDFKIGEGNSIMVLNTYMQPNPITDNGIISITHTASTAYDVEINIFNQSGALIRTINSIGSSLNKTIAEWDGRDAEGKQLAVGSYFYSVKLQTKFASALGYGKFIVLR